MSDKFQNKYRIPSARLQNWDYGSNAMYFVTICTAHRVCYFGEILDGEMKLSEIGKMVETEWLKTFEIRLDMNLQMGEFRVMPNHFHAIISFGGYKYNTKYHRNAYGDGDGIGNVGGVCGVGDVRRDAMHRVSTDASRLYRIQ